MVSVWRLSSGDCCFVCGSPGGWVRKCPRFFPGGWAQKYLYSVSAGLENVVIAVFLRTFDSFWFFLGRTPRKPPPTPPPPQQGRNNKECARKRGTASPYKRNQQGRNNSARERKRGAASPFKRNQQGRNNSVHARKRGAGSTKVK
eukprot:gene24892-biopygen22433